jgi:chitinase
MYINGTDECGLQVLEQWETDNASPITHYLLGFVVSDEVGTLNMDPAMMRQYPSDVTLINTTIVRIMKTAQANGKKVLLSMGGAGMGGDKASLWGKFVAAQSDAHGAAASIVAFLDKIKQEQQLTLDGIDFDYEPPARVPPRELRMMVDLTNALRVALDSWYPTVATGTGTARALISHAPQPPYMCVPNNGCAAVPSKNACDNDPESCAGAGYWYINEYAGDSIDLYIIQYYNNDYWDGVGTNTAIGARRVVDHVVALTRGQQGFKEIKIDKIVVCKPACHECACGIKNGCHCFMSAAQIIDLILAPVEKVLGSGNLPGVGFWQWGGLFGMQGGSPSSRLSDADLFNLGRVLTTISSNTYDDFVPLKNTCPAEIGKKACQTGGWGPGETKVYCSGGDADCVYGKCICKNGFYTTSQSCDKKGTGECRAAGPNNYTCSGHGTCDYNNGDKCDCACGWTGVDCSTRTTELNCAPASNPCNGNGSCGDDFKCVCDFGFAGETCDVQLPEACILDREAKTVFECGKFGVCGAGSDGKPKCTCLDNWTGDRCETLPKLPYLTYNYCRRGGDLDSCSGHGLCSNQSLNALGQTTGIDPVTGERLYQADFTPYPNVASNNEAHCVCNDGWTGKWCHVPADAKPCHADAECADVTNMYGIPYSCRENYCQMPITTYSATATLLMAGPADARYEYKATGAATTTSYCDITTTIPEDPVTKQKLPPVTTSSCWGMCGQDGATYNGKQWYGGANLPKGIDGIAAIPAFMFGERKVGDSKTPAGQDNNTGAACGTCWQLKSKRVDGAYNTVKVVIGDRCGGGCPNTAGEHHDCSDFFVPGIPGGLTLAPDALDPAARQKWLKAGGFPQPDWCASGSHPHFDLDSGTQATLCKGTALEGGNCLVDSFEQVPCDAVTGPWPKGCDKTGYWSQNCPVSN